MTPSKTTNANLGCAFFENTLVVPSIGRLIFVLTNIKKRIVFVWVWCSYDNRIKMYREDDDDWICFATLSSHTSTVWAAAFDKLGTRLVSVGDDATLKIWHQPEYKCGH